MYLLDTNHCSCLIFGEPTIINKIQEIGAENVAISSITEGELLYMAENSRYIADNLAIIEDFLNDISIYYVDSGTSHIYAKLKAKIMDCFAPKERNKRRKTRVHQLGINENDLWIASTAIQNNLIVVSADKDFQRIKQAWDFPLETWFDLLEN
ncbi:PilT protein domain protein [Rippkaea orientalis PCC 8801]|uniref:PilT protein domain protein n=1 Tax=Rippkaea orientalis (strain PCC 8801 / RF-1) TaxID=41431 RepID=B7K560_RIPO1|nr:type II toxin-antitoxin system VapC family toxin [Rippkaea orientalis]ACK67886.1 PilT protein domain protein [Rippkaea orientalis PCC 8801]